MRNELSRALSSADVKVQYDTQCKRVLSQKQILAWILKHTAEEFENLTLEEIENCIEEKPEISSIRVNPGETNETIIGSSTENAVSGEGAIFFDIRFVAHVPRVEEKIRLIINIEAQKEYYPGYQIQTRGIFYGARMISAQLGTEFADSDYDRIKKVYSIWICMDTPAYVGNAITVYSISKRDIVPGFPDIKESYDKMSVIEIELNEKARTENQFLQMMNVLLSAKTECRTKKKILTNQFGIRMENSLIREVDLMCNLSGYVEKLGIEKGENNLGKLISILLKQGELENIRLVSEDEQIRKEFYKKYGII